MAFRSLLSILDRQSTKSALYGQTGSIIGLLGTIAFLIIVIILYLIITINILSGVYYQSQYSSIQSSLQNHFTSGRDFKLAIRLVNKKTGAIYNHTKLLEEISVQYTSTISTKTYIASMYPCQADYLSGPKFINPVKLEAEDCIIIPYDTDFNTLGSLTIQFKTKCKDPFKCKSSSTNINNDPAVILFSENYYQIFFTSIVLNRQADSVFEVNRLTSNQATNNQNSITSAQTIFYNVIKKVIDDSIVPTRNRRQIKQLNWNGLESGLAVKENQIGNFGLQIYIGTSSQQKNGYRYYKKVDYLIGIIGGGFFLFFLIFYIPFTYFNRTLEKIKNTSSLLLEANYPYEGYSDLEYIKISFLYIFYGIIPCCGQKNKKLIEAAQEKINIVNLLKRVKVAERNLQMNDKNPVFKAKQLKFQYPEMQEGIQAEEATKKLEIPPKPLATLKQSPQTKFIYQNNPSMLAITDNAQQLKNTIQDEQIDKVKTNINPDRSKCYPFKKWASKIFRFFDVFGTNPNFLIQPQNSSCFGFLITLLILVCSVLTFAVTLKNMGTYQVFSSFDYHNPQQVDFKMITGKIAFSQKYYQLATCFSSTAIKDGYLTGNGVNRSAQVVYFTYQKFPNGSDFSRQYEGVLMSQSQTDYFSVENPSIYTFNYCFKIPDETQLPVAGSANSSRQGYFGMKLRPYCYGTPSQCLAKTDQTNQKFANFINIRTLVVYFPVNKYDSKLDKVIPQISANNILQSSAARKMQKNWAITQTQYLNQMSLIDDTSTWLVRQPPQVQLHKLNYDRRNYLRQYGMTQTGVLPEYKLIIRPSGQVQSIIKRGYKIDFLLGIIGGCFFFYYILFHWVAKIYNSFRTRAKLSQIHYNQEMIQENIITKAFHLIKIPLCLLCNCFGLKDIITRMRDVDNKIKRDLNVLNIVKKVENCWRLSSALYPTIGYKDASLIYLKQKIDEKERVIQQQNNQDERQLQNDDFLDEHDFEEEVEYEEGAHKISNQSQGNLQSFQLMPNGKISAKTQKDIFEPGQPQYVHSKYNGEQDQSCLDKITYFDLFSIKSQLTFNGQRKVKSICGGICCLILTMMIILILAHFVGINLSRRDYMVGREDSVAQTFEEREMTFNKDNFRLMVSFYTSANYQFLSLANFKNILQIQVVQRQYVYNNDGQKYDLRTINYPMQPCQDTYLDGWISQFQDPKYYSSLQNAFCLPLNATLQINQNEGATHNTFRNFYLTIYDKQNTTQSHTAFLTWLKSYFVMLHLPVAVRDFSKQEIKYQMKPFIQDTYLDTFSTDYNISFSKQIYIHEQNYAGEKTYSSYIFQGFLQYQQTLFLAASRDKSFKNFTFNNNNRIKTYVIDIPGVGQLFGLVGGVIILFIFGFSCIAQSFNNYRMKYLIGRQLYIFDRRPHKQKKKSKRQRQITNIKQINSYSQLSILKAWLLSPIGYIQRNYNFDQTLRHVTLIQMRVQEDLDIYKFTKKLSAVESQINKHIFLQTDKDLKLTEIYPKQVYCGSNQAYNCSDLFKKLAKNHRLSSFEQKKLQNAKELNIDPKKIFNDKYMWRSFQSQIRSENGQRTNAIGSSKMSRQHQSQGESHENDPSLNIQENGVNQNENEIKNQKNKVEIKNYSDDD